MSSTATGPLEPGDERGGGDGGVVQVAGAAVAASGGVMARRPRARVGNGLARKHEVDGVRGAVDGGACRLPGPGADERHRVVGEVARHGPDRSRIPAPAQRRVCEDVRDDPALPRILRQARGLPLVPRRGEVRRELRVMNLQQGVVGVRFGVDDPGVQGLADGRDAGGNLGRRGANAYPDLRFRLVE
jgi:hypothetical protein